MESTTTTDLNIIREYRRRFTWGRIIDIYDITDRYTIVQYVDKLSQATLFHVYVDGKSTNRSANTIEGAMLTAIGWNAYENKNTSDHMAQAACKLFDIKD